MTTPLMGTTELAEYLGVSKSFIMQHRTTHPLFSKALKLGGSTTPLKWHRSDVDAYLDSLRAVNA